MRSKKTQKNNSSDIVLLKNKDWSLIDGDTCKVVDFNPFLHSVKDGKALPLGKEMWTPYASVTFICTKAPREKITGFITHKMDFENLWEAFKERKIKQNEEVLFMWSRKNYKFKFLRFISGSLPKLWIMICKKGAYKLITDQNYKPKLTGKARFLAERPIREWKPEIMD